MTILVTGATGAVGRNLVDTLLEKGAKIRAISRNPEKAGLPEAVEVVSADISGDSFDAELFDDVGSIFVFPANEGVDGFVAAAVEAGVGHFVVLSSLAAAGEFPRDLGSASNVHHLAIEKSVTSRTDNWTILRPGTFNNNLLAWAWTVKSGAPIRAPYIHSAQAPIHERDIAEVAAVTLLNNEHIGKIYPLTGPESLTRIEQVAAISNAIGRRLELVEITPEEFRAEVSQFIPESIIKMLLDYWSDTVAEPDRVRPGVRELLGRDGLTLEQWAMDHKADFGV